MLSADGRQVPDAQRDGHQPGRHRPRHLPARGRCSSRSRRVLLFGRDQECPPPFPVGDWHRQRFSRWCFRPCRQPLEIFRDVFQHAALARRASLRPGGRLLGGRAVQGPTAAYGGPDGYFKHNEQRLQVTPAPGAGRDGFPRVAAPTLEFKSVICGPPSRASCRCLATGQNNSWFWKGKAFEGCANPDSDVNGSWCLVDEATCKSSPGRKLSVSGLAWDYCEKSPTQTVAGCACRVGVDR